MAMCRISVVVVIFSGRRIIMSAAAIGTAGVSGGREDQKDGEQKNADNPFHNNYTSFKIFLPLPRAVQVQELVAQFIVFLA